MSSRATSSILGFASLVGALLLSGCVDWSGDVARYQRALGGAEPATQPSAFDPAAPLPLARALQLANADNEAIASRGEDYIQALAEKMRESGTFLPTLTVEPSYTLSRSNGISLPGDGGPASVNSNSNQFSVPFNASATGSLSNVSSVQAADRTAEQRALLLLDERETILLEVVQSYYTALKDERQSAVYEHGVRLKVEKVRDQQARLKLGNVRPLDLAQSQSDLADTQASLIQSQTDAANARSALARLMAVPAVRGVLTDRFDPPPELVSLDRWQQQAAGTRQDLLAAARNSQSARFSVDAAIREYFPSVSLNFQVLLYNDPSSPTTWSNVLSANIPLFSALSIEAGVRKAWSVYRQALLNESQTRRQVTDDVNENYQNLIGSRLQVAKLEIEVRASKRAYDLSERSYQLGSVSNIDRLTVQDDLLAAELNLVAGELNAKRYYLALLRAAGDLSAVLHDPVAIAAR
jgi:outer membrane protein TolC